MVVEPPRERRMGRVLEIDDGVLIAVEQTVLKKLIGLVRHAGVLEAGEGVQMVVIELAEEGSRGRAVEAMVMVKYANAFRQHFCSGKLNRLPQPGRCLQV